MAMYWRAFLAGLQAGLAEDEEAKHTVRSCGKVVALDQQVEHEQKLERSRADCEACQAQLVQLQQHHSSLRQQHEELQQSHNCLQMEHKQLQTDHAGVVQAREQLTSDEMLQKLQERDEHISTIVDLRADAEKRLEAKQGELDRLVADFEQERRQREEFEFKLEELEAETSDHLTRLDWVEEAVVDRKKVDKEWKIWMKEEHARLSRGQEATLGQAPEREVEWQAPEREVEWQAPEREVEWQAPEREDRPKKKKKYKMTGRGTGAVLPRQRLSESLGHSNVILTAGGGSFGHTDGQKPDAISLQRAMAERLAKSWQQPRLAWF